MIWKASRVAMRCGGALLALAAGLVVAASPAAAETTISAEAVAPTLPAPGGSVPIVVTVKADRLIDGYLATPSQDFRFGASRATGVKLPVEVPGGSEKSFVLVVPTSEFGNGGADADLQIDVLLVGDDGTSIANRTVTIGAPAWTESVGILPALAAAERVPTDSGLRIEAGEAAFRAVPAAVLDAGVDALDPFGTLVGSADELDQLTPTQRSAVLRWVADGGILLLDGEAAPVGGLPEEWQPGAGGWSLAGAGEIRLVDGAATRGDWESIIEPTSSEHSMRLQSSPTNPNVNGPVSLTGSLASDAGFRMPDFRALLVGLAWYAVIIGPIVFAILAKARRRMAFWVAVPVGSIVASLLFVVVGSSFRSNADTAQTAVVEHTAAGGTAEATALVGSNSGGSIDLRFPGGWRTNTDPEAAVGSLAMGRSGPEPVAAEIVPDGANSAAHVELGPGEYQLVSGVGPVDSAPSLAVDAEATDGTVTGTVRNLGQAPVRAVVILSGQTATEVGDLAAGEERRFEIDAAPMQSPESRYWDLTTEEVSTNRCCGDFGFAVATTAVACGPGACPEPLPVPSPKTTPAGQTNPVNGAAWVSYLRRSGTALRTADQVTAVGWTDGAASPVHGASGEPIARGRVAVVTRGNVSVAGKLSTTGARVQRVRQTDLRGQDERRGDADLRVNGPLIRVVLPPAVDGRAVDPGVVQVELPSGVTQAQVWVGNGWRFVQGTKGTDMVIRLSADAVTRGVAYLRTGFNEEFATSADPQSSVVAVSVTTADPETVPPDGTVATALTDEEIANRPAPFAEVGSK